MRDVFDIYTIIFLALAVFIFLRLRSVLGTRTGRERPPFDPYAPRDARAASSDKVVTLPQRNADGAARPADAPAPADRWKGITEADSPIAKGLDAIVAADPTFDPAHFVTGAKGAYEMIVGAFAAGDRRALQDLLSPDVYENFEAAIKEREGRGETQETRFVSIDKAQLVGAEMRGKSAHVTVSFVSQQITVTRNAKGEPIDGSAEAVTDLTDVWTFARDTSTRDPNWKLVTTESAQ